MSAILINTVRSIGRLNNQYFLLKIVYFCRKTGSFLRYFFTNYFWGENNQIYSILVASNEYKLYFLTVGLSFFVFSFQTNFDFEVSSIYTLFVYFVVRLIYKLKSDIPVKELTIFVLFLQMVILPMIVYRSYHNEIGYEMVVKETAYFAVVMPLIISFIIGLFIPVTTKKINLFDRFLMSQDKISQALQIRYGKNFVMTGVVAYLMIFLLPNSLFFFMSVISYFRFIGVFYLLLSNYKYKYLITIGIFGEFLFKAVSEGMFYDLIVWGGFLMAVLLVNFRISFLSRTILFSASLFLIFVLQSVKQDYREVIWSDNYQSSNEMNILYDKVKSKIGEENIIQNETNVERFIQRLNTGHITAMVIEHTPFRQPFSDGQDLMEDIKASLMPRFLFPNKKTVGGEMNRAKFERYTGKSLRKGTIMRIGVLADSYINFGLIGGSVLLFIFGYLLNILLVWLKNKSSKYPLIVCWLPLIFMYIVRMSDYIVLINSVLKILAVLVFIMIFYKNWLMCRRIDKRPIVT